MRATLAGQPLARLPDAVVHLPDLSGALYGSELWLDLPGNADAQQRTAALERALRPLHLQGVAHSRVATVVYRG